jgi:hypothetical protein
MIKIKMKEDFYNPGDRLKIWYVHKDKIFDEYFEMTYGIPYNSKEEISKHVVDSFYNNIYEYLQMTFKEKFKIYYKCFILELKYFYNRNFRKNSLWKETKTDIRVIDILKTRIRTIKNNEDVFNYINELKTLNKKEINYSKIKDNLFSMLVDYKKYTLDIQTGVVISKVDLNGKKYYHSINGLCQIYSKELNQLTK